MFRPPDTTDRRPLTTTPAEADLTLATGSHDPAPADSHHLLAEAATTIPGAAAPEPKSRHVIVITVGRRPARPDGMEPTSQSWRQGRA